MAIKHGQLHCRSLEMLKTQSLQDYSSYDALITFDEKSSQELMWWKQNVSTNNGRFIKEIIATPVGVQHFAPKAEQFPIPEDAGHLSRQTEPSLPTFSKEDLGGLQIIDKQLVQKFLNELSKLSRQAGGKNLEKL
eukprot:gene4933-21273_t